MPINQDFKDIIIRIKYEFNLNQSQIAERLGVKSTYLSDMINGRVPYNESMGKKIHEVFHISKDENMNYGQNFGSIGGNNRSTYNNVGNTSNEDTEFLKQKIELLELRLKEKDDIIQAKNETIETKNEIIENLKAKIK
nr:MAG TPA: helix-turn-helix domain protein [Bacteriophage sp.]